MKSARDRLSIIFAYQQVGTYRGAAAVAAQLVDRAELGTDPQR